MENTKAEDRRWKATVKYFDGSSDEHLIEEIGELQSIVDHGPDWRIISSIEINYNGYLPVGPIDPKQAA